FYVDNTPIRVSKNISNIGVNYPSQTLVIQASIWDGEGWASNGRKLDWSQQPFTASFQGFNVDGCQSLENSNKEQCYDSRAGFGSKLRYGSGFFQMRIKLPPKDSAGVITAFYNSNVQECYSPKYWWNSEKYWKLDSKQQIELENVRNKYMSYDYCSDRPRYPVPPPECLLQ
ncbi:hypothetical protein POUND7_012843, partial [Theobroma cacao]